MTNLHGWKERFDRLHADLLQIFGQRLQSLVAYQTHFGLESQADSSSAGGSDDHAHAMVLVASLAYADLVACAARVADWHDRGLATPLVLGAHEFERSLDAFPLEMSAISAHHVLVAGTDPFAALPVERDDVRRACETQARSHLLHLREGFMEVQGEPPAVARLIAASVPPLRTLLLNLARLDEVHAHNRDALVRHAASTLGIQEALLEQLLAIHRPEDLDRSDTLRVYAAYLDAVERLTRFVDGWSR